MLVENVYVKNNDLYNNKRCMLTYLGANANNYYLNLTNVYIENMRANCPPVYIEEYTANVTNITIRNITKMRPPEYLIPRSTVDNHAIGVQIR